MNKLSSLPEELQFLREIGGDRNQQYQSASWLKSPFEENIWLCDFGKHRRFTLDFCIKLDDGSLLTEPRHNELLVTFKCWICAQTHFDATGGIIISELTAYNVIILLLKIIDYFLMNAAKFSLATYGLGIITEGDLKMLLSDLASSSDSRESIYRWSENLEQYLKNKSSLLSLSELDEIQKSHPSLAIIDTDRIDRTLKLSDNELIRARIYLWKENLYIKGGHLNYKYHPNTKALSSIIYRNTLWGRNSKSIHEELCIGPMERYHHEYPAVLVTTNEENQLSEKMMNRYQAALRSLGLLEEIGLPIPAKAIGALSQKVLLEALKLKSVGRFRTLPQNVVFPSLKNAMEFALEYGDDLIDSYLNLVRAANDMGLNFLDYTMQEDIRNVITPKVRNFGVQVWNLSYQMLLKEHNYWSDDPTRPEIKEYFCRFRSNEGLFEILRVFYGSVQVCVGMLMARRKSELLDLIAGKCLDRSNKNLLFYNAKSGTVGKREKEARPIPDVSVRMIKMLERLQIGLIELGHLKHFTNLFSRPARTGMIIGVTSKTYYSAMDAFCDYFETPLNANCERYYIRQHQLRRFFAMLFFLGRAFGGLETLRWFFAHTDVEHLYHYISESTPGAVLRSVKAIFATEQVKEQSEGSGALADLLQEHFNTRQFSVLDSEELAEYIEYLLQENKVEIEPEFIKTADGQSYKILIKVIG